MPRDASIVMARYRGDLGSSCHEATDQIVSDDADSSSRCVDPTRYANDKSHSARIQ